jgi:hypothetical protein
MPDVLNGRHLWLAAIDSLLDLGVCVAGANPSLFQRAVSDNDLARISWKVKRSALFGNAFVIARFHCVWNPLVV